MQTRLRSTAAVAGLLAAWAALPYAQRDRAGEILAQAREAIGGEARLRAVRSVSLDAESRVTGGITVVIASNPDGAQTKYVGNEHSKSKVEIDALLPDKFLLTRSGGPHGFRGVNGDRAILNRAALGRAILADPRFVAIFTTQQHREFLRYMVALLLMPPEQYSVRFTDEGEAATEDGLADVLQANGAYDFAARLFFEKGTHRLLELAFREPPRPGSAAAPSNPAKAGPDEGATDTRSAGQAGAREVLSEPFFKRLVGPVGPPAPTDPNMHMRLADYRPVDGILLPYRITTELRGETDQWSVSTYKVNPPLKPKRFEK